jgi:hypothetical protein
MGEAVANVTKFSVFDILFDRIEWFLFGDFHFSVRPARDLNDHIENTIVGISKKRNIVEG